MPALLKASLVDQPKFSIDQKFLGGFLDFHPFKNSLVALPPQPPAILPICEPIAAPAGPPKNNPIPPPIADPMPLPASWYCFVEPFLSLNAETIEDPASRATPTPAAPVATLPAVVNPLNPPADFKD